jgi:hypothetical protein
VVSRPLVGLQRRRLNRLEERLQVLSGRAFRGEGDSRRELAVVEQRLHDLPVPAALMPTRLGNVLRAAEDRVRDRYGLDPVVCWPHLWLCLDEDPQREIAGARQALDEGARLWLWSLLFLAWTWVAWWAPIVTVLGGTAAYYGVILPRARGYGQLTQAAFDLYRRRLYQTLNWPVPTKPDREPAAGAAVTTYLFRGIAPDEVTFHD